MIKRNSIKKLAALSLLVIFFAGCKSKKQGMAGASGGAAPTVMPYKVAPVYSGKATMRYSFPATIQGEQNVEIRPKVDGFIEKIYVDEGANVRKGQRLFKLNNPQYEQTVRSAAAAVKIAEADVLSAEMNVEKVKPLVEKNIISKYELEANQYALTSKQAALASARAGLYNAKVNLGYTTINSPSNGVVGTIPFKVGSLVSGTAGNALTTVYNTTNVYAYFSLNEKQLLNFSRAVQGKTLQDKLAKMQDVTLVLADGTTYTHKGRITTSSGMVNTETGSVNFRATFPNPDGLIRSGSSATIEIPIPLDTAILVPQIATFDLQGTKFVYKVIDQDSIINSAITVDEISIGNLYIVRNGLKSGDVIVVDGVGSLRPGTLIKPVMVNADSLYMNVGNAKK